MVDGERRSGSAEVEVRFDESTPIRSGGGHGTVHLLSLESTDGTRTVTVTQTGLLPDEGDLLQLHWGCLYEGEHEWKPPPEGAVLPAGTAGCGDGMASRSDFGSDGKLVFSFPPGVGDTIERVVGVVLRNREDWLHAEAGDLLVPLKAPSSGGVLRSLAMGESPGSGSLFARFGRINEQLDASLSDGPSGAAAVMATLRLSAIRQLPWYAGGNYQSKEMAHIQEVVAQRVAHASLTAPDGISRQMYRAALSTLPRGGGNGDDIRMGILDLMREHGIKEGHRPGIEDPFLEQWHQKLHSNTTVDDVHICEAYLHFLRTGHWEDFWAHLRDHHGLTREDLAGMKAGWRTEGIVGPGNHLPQLIGPMEQYCQILRITHGGGSMDSAMEFARGHMPEDVEHDIEDLLTRRDEPWVPVKIVEIRERLSGAWRSAARKHTHRDVALLDIAMDRYFRNRVEGMADLGGADERLRMLGAAIRNVCVGGDFDRMQAALGFFQKASNEAEHDMRRWGPAWSNTMLAALETVSLAMGHHMDQFCQLAQCAADVIGRQAKCDDKYIVNFGEECVRGHSMFAVSKMLGEARAAVRQAAGRSPWDIVSPARPDIALFAARVVVTSLADIQGTEFGGHDPVVVLSSKLGGLEDIPRGVVAVLTASPVDLLSHIAIRARQANTLLAATVPDASVWNDLTALDGRTVRVCLTGNGVSLAESEPVAATAPPTATGHGQGQQHPPPPPHLVQGGLVLATSRCECVEWVVGPKEYQEGVVGAKSRSLSSLGSSPALSHLSTARVPGSSALPFNAFGRALAAEEATSAEVALAAAALSAAHSSGDAGSRRDALERLRDIVTLRLGMPPGLAEALEPVVRAHGGGTTVDAVYTAVKRVWASKWSERAYLSRKAWGVCEEDLHMATLLMEVVPAEVAFVLHTVNPITGDDTELFGELCVGLGDALVGNEPGSALSFTAKKAKGSPYCAVVRSLPSKPLSHHPPRGTSTIIARSDSNGEDLEGFAGAGLYDSVVADGTETRLVRYADEWIVWDGERRAILLAKLAELGVAIEAEMQAPQDIEGCVVGDDIYVLQSRRQVM